MLQTIEVEIDATGHIAPLEVLPMPAGRALLTLLPASEAAADQSPADLASELPTLGTLFGILKAQGSATGDDIKAAIRRRAASRFYDRD